MTRLMLCSAIYVFHAAGTMTYDFGSIEDTLFENNLFFGDHRDRPADPHALTVEALFVRPGGGSDGGSTADAYKLLPDSPCLGAGKTIAGNGGRDFWGNVVPVNERPAIGAYNR